MSETLTNTQLKQRILGAGILVLLAAVLIPMFLGDPKYVAEEGEQKEETAVFESKIQPLPGSAEDGNTLTDAQKGDVESSGGLVLKKLDADAPRKTRKGTAQPKDVVIKPLDMKEAVSGTEPPKQQVAAPKPEPAPAPKPKPAAPKKVAQPAPAKKASPTPSKQPAQASKSAVTRGWVVQAGVFGKAKNATDLAAVLKSNGYSPRVSDVTGRPGIKKRVWIGPFANKSEAQAVSKKLQQQIGNAGYIAPYPFNS